MTRPPTHPSAPWQRIRAVTAAQWGLDPMPPGEAWAAGPVRQDPRPLSPPVADRFRFWPCSAAQFGARHATHPFS